VLRWIRTVAGTLTDVHAEEEGDLVVAFGDLPVEMDVTIARR
jgi:hypothetical protein